MKLAQFRTTCKRPLLAANCDDNNQTLRSLWALESKNPLFAGPMPCYIGEDFVLVSTEVDLRLRMLTGRTDFEAYGDFTIIHKDDLPFGASVWAQLNTERINNRLNTTLFIESYAVFTVCSAVGYLTDNASGVMSMHYDFENAWYVIEGRVAPEGHLANGDWGAMQVLYPPKDRQIINALYMHYSQTLGTSKAAWNMVYQALTILELIVKLPGPKS